MTSPADQVTLCLPREALVALVELPASFSKRMHELLERNTEGQLPGAERIELEALVRMVQFSQIAQAALMEADSTEPA
jgi:hypothetical protein